MSQTPFNNFGQLSMEGLLQELKEVEDDSEKIKGVYQRACEVDEEYVKLKERERLVRYYIRAKVYQA